MPYFVTDDNCKLYYEENGEGKPVVFIHGWDCNRHFFKRQLPEFRNNYKVLAYDLRGHGDSDRTEYGNTLEQMAKDLRDLLAHRELKDVTLVGWSMGVFIIFEYIRQYGTDNLHKVVLIDMTPRLVTDESWSLGLFGKYDVQSAMEYMHEMAKDWNSVVEGFVPAMFGPEPDEQAQEEIQWIKGQARKNTPHVMINYWMAMVLKDYRDMLSTIDIPVLITYGTKPSLYSPETSEWLRGQIKGAELAGFDGGHIHFIQDIENFNRRVREFIG